MPVRDNFFARLLWLTLAAALLIVLWRAAPVLVDGLIPRENVAPRTVTARGDIAEDEKATISLFENSRDSVVFITTKAQVRDFWTRNVFTVPQGSGSGFIWDDAGHVVTNYHVIQNTSQASVKLADGRDYRAALLPTGTGGGRLKPTPMRSTAMSCAGDAPTRPAL
jgi:S1-C subfamily serine protease